MVDGEVTTQVTLASIAALAGVSQPTVSKVLNGRADVAPKTRAKVEQLLQDAGYRRRRRPSAAAPYYTIDLALPAIRDLWATEIIHGVEAAARKSRAVVSIFELGTKGENTDSWLESAIVRGPSAVLFVFTALSAAHRSELDARGIQCVVIDPVDDETDGLPAVGSSNFQGGRAAARHLLEIGHTRIGVIGGPSHLLACRARIAGFSDALTSWHVPIDQSLMKISELEVDGGYSAALELLDRPDRPTAVFASSDLQALGVYRAAAELGMSIPRDLSVVGYDGLPLCGWISPQLTSVVQPLAEMTAQATELVLDLAAGSTRRPRHVELAVKLHVRESTAPPPDRTSSG